VRRAFLQGGRTLVVVVAGFAGAFVAPASAAVVSPLLAPQVLSPVGQLAPEFPMLAVAPSGAAAASWLNQSSSFWVARRPSATGAWTVEQSPGGGGWDRVTLAVDGAGRTLVIERDGSNPPYPVSLRVRGSAGWSAPIPVSAMSGGGTAPPAMATAADGRVVLVWGRQGFDVIGVRVWDPATQSLGPLMDVTSTNGLPRVAVSPSGRVLVMGRYELQPDSSLLDTGVPDGFAAVGDDGTVAVAALTGAAGNESVSLTVDPAGPTLPVTRQLARVGSDPAFLNQERNTGQVALADGVAIATWTEGDIVDKAIRVGEVDVASGVAGPALTIDRPGNHAGGRNFVDKPFLPRRRTAR
jgi:hypothetical protein